MVDAELTLRKVLDKILDEKDYLPRDVTVKAISTDGANYTTVLFIVNVTSPNRIDLKLFAKVACVAEANRPLMFADWLYQTEKLVYTKISKIYEEIENENNIPLENRFIFPIFYGFSDELGKEVVVMENMNESGYAPYDRHKSIDWAHASVAVENLARFHALSFAFEKYRPEEFKMIIAERKCPLFAEELEPEDPSFDVWFQSVDKSLEVIEEGTRDVVRSHIMKHRNMSKMNKPLRKPVLVHGDYKLSNLLFKKQNESIQTIAVDFQTVHAGCPAGDLIFLIFLGSDEEFSRQYYAKLLDHYYLSLEKAMKRFSVDPTVYSREDFDSDMNELLPYVVPMAAMILPAVTVDAEVALKVDGDANLTEFFNKHSELFAERFKGVVNDCLRWGAI